MAKKKKTTKACPALTKALRSLLREQEPNRRVFTNCNDCGLPLRTDEEYAMGLCDKCANDESGY